MDGSGCISRRFWSRRGGILPPRLHVEIFYVIFGTRHWYLKCYPYLFTHTVARIKELTPSASKV
jgi:hypothetical protein